MSQPSIRVQHCVLTTLARRHGSRPVFDLLEVQYEYEVPPRHRVPEAGAEVRPVPAGDRPVGRDRRVSISGVPPDRPGWRLAAVEYFRVVK